MANLPDYEVITLHTTLEGFLGCDDCGEPITRIEHGRATTLFCTNCGWSVYTATPALREWERSGRVSLPKPRPLRYEGA
jgi:hypothetical protein